MKGAALKENKYVDVNTLLNYALEEVPYLADGIGGIQQLQLLVPKGGSFDIGILEEADRIKIPLAQLNPVFVRSSFLNIDEQEDNLNLSTFLDEQLMDASYKGTEAQLIFVDTKEYSGGCRVSGTYNKVNNSWIVHFKIKCGEKEIGFNVTAANEIMLKKELFEKVQKSIESP